MSNNLTMDDVRELPPDLAWRAVCFPFKHILELIKLVLLPSLIVIAIFGVVLTYTSYENNYTFGINNLSSDSIISYLSLHNAISLLYIICSIMYFTIPIIFAVGIHRYIIINEKFKWVIFRFKKYEFVYLACIIIDFILTILIIKTLSIITSVILVSYYAINHMINIDIISIKHIFYFAYRNANDFTEIQIAIQIIASFIAMILLARFALIFPHAAVSGKLSFSIAWNALKGKFLMFIRETFLFGVYFIIIAVFFIIAGIAIYSILNLIGLFQFTMFGNQFVLIIGSTLLSLFANGILFGMTVAFISYTYQATIENAS